MKEQPIKRTFMKVDARLHRALKIASIQEEKSLQEITEEVLRKGMQAKGIPVVDRKAI